MSQEQNTQLLERASELIDDLVSHPAGLDRELEQAVASNDLEELRRVVNKAEGVLACEYFYHNGILSRNEEY